ncbi:MAG: ferredoxin family protein [Bacillota bacterium]
MTLKDTPREEIPWYPTILEEECTGCGTCYEFCPHGTYEWNREEDRPTVAKPYNCVVGCSNCRPLCPAGAIEFPPLAALRDYR